MADITITITGPGGCISTEGVVVRRALEAAGIRVVSVVDDAPPPCSEEELLAHLAARGKSSLTVQIVMDHRPWGG